MLATALSPYIGYEKAAKAAQTAAERGITLREACADLGLLSMERFDEIVRPERMV
jgi:fumarate hydratase class II